MVGNLQLVLASTSPRRRQLLKLIAPDFEIMAPEFEETAAPGLLPAAQAIHIARGKAQSVFDRLTAAGVSEGKTVLGVDTIVVLDGVLYPKPLTRQRAVETLAALSGRTHEVISGYYIKSARKFAAGSVSSLVTFNKLTDKEIEEYVDKYRPFDKSGGYGVQDDYRHIEKVQGSVNNVVGLPTEKLQEELRQF